MFSALAEGQGLRLETFEYPRLGNTGRFDVNIQEIAKGRLFAFVSCIFHAGFGQIKKLFGKMGFGFAFGQMGE